MKGEMRVQEQLAPRMNGGDPRESGTSAFPPLAGKTVAIVHPAWHSCGSHQVFVSQARAYHSLGANVISLAIADIPGCIDGSRTCKAYISATGDLEADTRLFTGMPLRNILSRGFLRAAKQWLHGNDAAMRVEIARRAAMEDALALVPRLDLIHCNHFFCMPAAVRLREKRACPIFLDTHDLQARQYALHNGARFKLLPAVRYEEMLAIELDAMCPADLLIHLNDEEATAFKKLVPGKRHALLYPTVNEMPVAQGGGDLIIVASANYPNFLGLCWFLREVLPLASGVSVQIFGNIDRELQTRAPALYKAHAALFHGRVGPEDLHAAYRRASAVLLPAIAGHGISIKTIEALSCGAPLIATSLAFRGLGIDLADVANVTVADDGPTFAAALRRVYANRHLPSVSWQATATRQIYEARFAFDAYCSALLRLLREFMTLKAV
jgi:glycosyltransferase involved in cell wall biosynthesis